MTDFAALDVALGLAFVFTILSVICSALNEAVSSALGWRAKFLRTGIANLLDPTHEREGHELVKALYRHPIVNGLIRPVSAKGKLRYPSYLPARTFVAALLDFDATGAERSCEEAIAAIPSAQARTALTRLLVESGGDAERFRASVERWYDDAMERVSGWYTRRVHLMTWLLALGVAVTLNADTVRITQALWADKTVRAAVVATADNRPPQQHPDLHAVAKDVGSLHQLAVPIGWTTETRPSGAGDWIATAAMKLVGLLLTGAAVSLGAPFWFDALGKIARLRSTGGRPARARTRAG